MVPRRGITPGTDGLPPNERCCSQRHSGTLCNSAALRAAPFTAILLEPLQQNAALDNMTDIYEDKK